MVIVVVFVVNLVKIVQWNVYIGLNQLLKSFDWGTGLVKAILKAGGSKFAESARTQSFLASCSAWKGTELTQKHTINPKLERGLFH